MHVLWVIDGIMGQSYSSCIINHFYDEGCTDVGQIINKNKRLPHLCIHCAHSLVCKDGIRYPWSSNP